MPTRSTTPFAETTNGLYKAECVYGPDSHGWDDVADLELATLSWVHWFNEQRLHRHCGDVPPAEFETAFYAALQADPAGVGTNNPSLPPDRRFILAQRATGRST